MCMRCRRSLSGAQRHAVTVSGSAVRLGARSKLFVGDLFLDPVNYLDLTYLEITAIHAYDRVNETSLEIGAYEEIKETSLDPYTFIRDAYEQHRRSKIKE